MATAAGAWDRLRDQLYSLERALAAASAPGSGASSSNGWQAAADAGVGPGRVGVTSSGGASSIGSGSGGLLEARLAEGACVTVRTRGGATLEVAVPDPDAAARGLQPAPSPRLAAAGKVIVCTGRKCCAQGARCTLAAAQRAAAGSDVEVAASKCMGKCGQGPCVRTRVSGREGSALTKGVNEAGAVNLLRQQFGTTC
jgi:(2Fe-2S) ferredoxin